MVMNVKKDVHHDLHQLGLILVLTSLRHHQVDQGSGTT